MPDPVRFTPEELKELVGNGSLTQEDLALLHPADAAVASSLIQKNADPMAGLMSSNEVNPRMGLGGFQPDFDLGHAATIQAGMSAVPAIATTITGGPLAGLAAFGRQAAPYAGGLAGGAIGNAFGHPYAGWAIGTALAGGKPFGRGRPPKPPTTEPLPPKTPATMTGTGAERPPMTMTGFSRPDQITTSATPNAAKPPRLNTAPTPEAPNVRSSGPGGVSGLDVSEMMERTGKGVTNNFRGRVHIQKDPPTKGSIRSEFPPGANAKTPPAEFKRLLEELAESAYNNDDEIRALREFIRPKLRKPGK
jgi:hypothetical protein